MSREGSTSAFILCRAMGRIVRSAGLLSISMWPSVRNRIRPFPDLEMYFSNCIFKLRDKPNLVVICRAYSR
jgi:hypothetical protein